jgi:putative ABC transport system permease protein
MPLADALAGRDGMPGAVMDRVLIDRLGLAHGRSAFASARRISC